jgi:protein gp37
VSTGCNQTLNKMDVLRKIPCAVRWISSEPLLEDISQDINLDGFHWVVTGGESGSGKEYLYDPKAEWRTKPPRKMGEDHHGMPFPLLVEAKDCPSRRTMMLKWAENLRDKTKAAGLPFMFKQVTSARSGQGVNGLGQDWHEFPDAPHGLKWAPRNPIDPKNEWTPVKIENLRKEQNGY